MSQGRRKDLTPPVADLFGAPPSPPKPIDASQEASPDRVPHFIKHGAAHIFVHPCSACGAPDAPFGTGVFLRQRKYGTWLCGPCWRAKRGHTP